jgi:hypothetical protein
MEGKVIHWEHENSRKHRKASAERVTVDWIQDGMRHSFASYWLPIHHDVDCLMGQMGHTDPATFSRHYHAGVPRAEAKKFWAIVRRNSGLGMSFNSSRDGPPEKLRKLRKLRKETSPTMGRFDRASDGQYVN